MKQYIRKYLLAFLSILLAINVFIYNSLTVYAIPKRLLDGTWIDIPLSEAAEEASYYIQYGLSMIGVVVNGDFEQWLKNSEAYRDLYDDNGRLAKNISVDTETGNVTYDKEIMIVLKNAVDDYAKQETIKEENGGFYLLPTMKMDDVPVSWFANEEQYITFKNILNENGVLAVSFTWTLDKYGFRFIAPFSNPANNVMLVGNATHLNELETKPSRAVSCNFFWGKDYITHYYTNRVFPVPDQIYTSISDAEYYNSDSNYSHISAALMNFDLVYNASYSKSNYVFYSVTGEKIRVFVSKNAAQSYALDKRKVYFTKEYYSYVPEDLTVSIDDLQKSVDDLQDVIDKLLEQITKDTSESDIEDILKQILDELRNTTGGGGSGSGGSGVGDVTVDIDLGTTNSWLAKIYAKVSQIYEKMSETVENAEQSALDGIQTKLDEISETLKKIKGWTIADTVVDAADVVADWLDLIHDLFNDAEAGAGVIVSSLSSALGNSAGILSSKFPFCVPWDIFAIVSFLRAEPEAPHFKLPIILERYGIESYIEIDMEPFQVVSDISRTMLALLYAYGLVMLTGKVIDIGKEVP